MENQKKTNDSNEFIKSVQKHEKKVRKRIVKFWVTLAFNFVQLMALIYCIWCLWEKLNPQHKLYLDGQTFFYVIILIAVCRFKIKVR